MEYRLLGRTGIRVSRMCFGVLTIGPLQANLGLAQGAALIQKAFEVGVNFLDTAELYRTYPYIRRALREHGNRDRIVVASKSYAYTRSGMRKSVERARRGMGLDTVDLFLLHEQESALTLRGHRPALEYLVECRDKGLVRAVGVSTHCAAVVWAAAEMEEIDVIHPVINYTGLGIRDAGIKEMLAAVRTAHQRGKGIYAMKPLGGGNLVREARRALEFVRDLPYVDSVAVGVRTEDEVVYDALILGGGEVDPALACKVAGCEKRLLVETWCRGCGRCVKVCPAGALHLEGGRPVVDQEKCVLCGYCGAACNEFCIRIV